MNKLIMFLISLLRVSKSSPDVSERNEIFENSKSFSIVFIQAISLVGNIYEYDGYKYFIIFSS